MSRKQINAEVNKALSDPNLQAALGKFCDIFPQSRATAYAGRDFPSLQREIAAIKRESASRMDELAAGFEREVTRRGGVVFRARTAEDARRYILELARKRGVEVIVKGKSMATEEIFLNDYLKGQGFDVVETDLGERILQLSDTHPSHMVMPAIHLTRQQVAEVFTRHTGEQAPEDIPGLVKLARRLLREKFLVAGMGISGANAAVAESGTIVVLTNEGNGRLTTTLPPIHVAVIGLEKLVPRLADVGPILEALPRSATAQQLTSYVTMITGTTPVIDRDGAERQKELHIVLLDNGRSALRDDPVFAEAMQCIRCASCLNVCPVFQKVGGHVFGHVYTGGIGTVLTAFFHGITQAAGFTDLCIGCGRCREFCPAGIDIPRLVLGLKERRGKAGELPFTEKVFLTRVLTNRALFHGMLKAGARVQKPFVQQGMIRHLPLWFAGLTRDRALPPIADRALRSRTAEFASPATQPTKRVAVFAGCLADFVYPSIGIAMSRVLARGGMLPVFPQGQTCCGYPAQSAGLTDIARILARRNILAMEEARPDLIVTPCPTCTVAIKDEYPALLADDPVWGPRAREMAARVVDFPTLVRDHLNLDRTYALKDMRDIIYHDPCHQQYRLGVTDAPREALERAGFVVLDEPGPRRCCGFGGLYSVLFPDLSTALLAARLEQITGSGAQAVVTDCPGCMLQLRGGLDAEGLTIPVLHTAEALAMQEKK